MLLEGNSRYHQKSVDDSSCVKYEIHSNTSDILVDTVVVA